MKEIITKSRDAMIPTVRDMAACASGAPQTKPLRGILPLDRRGFLRLALAVVACLAAPAGLFANDSLSDGFANPPPAARSQVWWHWMNGNVTKEGITADLEAMAKAGIGGATIFDVTDHIPEGNVGFATDEWFEMLRHADAEARRLGLALCLANCSGWSTAGGPWVKPEDSMKRVVFTETPVKGGTRFEGEIPRFADSHGFYSDIALLAVPKTKAESIDPRDYGIGVSATFTKDADKLAAMRECREIPKCCNVRRPKEGGKPNVATFTFERPFPLSGLVCSLKTPGRYMRTIVTLEVSVDGKTFRKAGKHKIYLRPFGSSNETDLFLPCPCADARAVRVAFDFPAGMAGVTNKLQLLRPTAAGGIPEFRAKIFALRSAILGIPYEVRPDQIVRLDDIVDLAAHMKPDGTLDWTAPEGRDWRIFRFGYAAKGRTNHPATRLGVGQEVDKLSAAAVERHFNAYIGRAADMFGPKTPFPQSGFNNVIVDSYEAGCQNWTDGFDTIFRERKGYDIVRYMPLFAGCIIDGKEETERVLSDFRRVVSDLFIENFAMTFARLCHGRGLYFSLEGYGNAPCDDLKYARWGDCTMAEFWAGTDSDPLKKGNSNFGGSVAHVWGGGRVVSAEAFTSGGDTRRWLKHPFAMKAQADLAWCSGVNQIVYHSYPHQPWLNEAAFPGMTMGAHGTHYGRTLTWWDQSGAWHAYQARAQFLLQQGVACSDALVYNGDSAPNFGLDVERWHRYDKAEPLPRAYSWDACGGDAIAAMRVKDGKIIAPSGASYSFLCVTDSPGAVSPESRADIERLKSGGALVFSGNPGEKAIAGAGIAPDVVCDRKDLTWIHRRADDGTDIYFLAMPNEKEESFEVSFRISGRAAELWDPATGERALCRGAKDDGTRTTVPMAFDPFGSAFVLFRPVPTPGLAPARMWRKLGETVVEGEWNVAFIDGRGAPEKAVFDRLVSWTERPEDGIRHYSGSAVYSKTIAVPASGRVLLDLGEVKEVVDVTVNGKTYPTLWKPPFRLDITDAVEGRAEAQLSLKVTNLWPNRLIGDDALPPDAEYRPDGSLAGIPAWVPEGKASPVGRNAFATWRHWRKEDKLLPSGLVGPIKIETGCLED